MKSVTLGRSSLLSSRLIYGCMRVAGAGPRESIDESRRENARAAIVAAYEAGYTHFDHADIYCHGGCEAVFGEVMRNVSGMRERVVITTKCGIRFDGDPGPNSPKRYDFSPEHIQRSCEASLERLGVETIDLYLLHRPDILMAPGEVASAFDRLRQEGKVREFGVSNFSVSQVDTLQAFLPMPLACHQVAIHPGRLDAFVDGSLNQCLRLRMTPTAWSPFGGGLFTDTGEVAEDHPRRDRLVGLLATLDQVAAEHGVGRSVVTLAWLLRHPAGVLPIIGTTRPSRIRDAAAADGLNLDREAWYRIYAAAGGPMP